MQTRSRGALRHAFDIAAWTPHDAGCLKRLHALADVLGLVTEGGTDFLVFLFGIFYFSESVLATRGVPLTRGAALQAADEVWLEVVEQWAQTFYPLPEPTLADVHAVAERITQRIERVLHKPEHDPDLDKPQQLGLFDQAHGYRPAPPPQPDAPTRMPGRHPWQWLLRRVFRVDISVCPRCQGATKVTEVALTADSIATVMARHGLGPQPPPPTPRSIPGQPPLPCPPSPDQPRKPPIPLKRRRSRRPRLSALRRSARSRTGTPRRRVRARCRSPSFGPSRSPTT